MRGWFAAVALLVGLVGNAVAEPLVVLFENNARHAVTSLRIAEPGGLDDEPDITEGSGVAPDEAVELELAPDRGVCRYDVRLGFADGLTVEEQGVDFCRQGTYRALGGTLERAGGAAAVAAGDGCNWEKEGTEVGALLSNRYGSTPPAVYDAAMARMGEALTAAVTGELGRACAIYAALRKEHGGR